jgi:molybdate transport system ATP-binding protein
MQEKADQPPALVSLENVVLQQSGARAACPLTWTIHSGEQWAIIGPHNAGKRVLAETLAGRAPILRGRICWYSARPPDYGGFSPAERGGAASEALRDAVAYVTFDRPPTGDAGFHQARWHADLTDASPTVAEALSFSGVWRRNPFEISCKPAQPEVVEQFRERHADILLALALKPLLQRHLHQLSDGEWRRLQIGRALLRSPRLLILDHPLEGLDQAFRPHLNQVLTRLTTETALQVVVVAASSAALMDMITHMLVMDNGRITAQGPVQEVASQIASQEVHGASKTISSNAAKRSVPPPALVRMHNINILHSGVRVLENVTWTVRQGEKWALVGPNGAGKSTILSLIMGDHPQAYANEIELFGQRRGSGESIWEIKRHIGWVAPELQRYHPPEVSALDIVCSGYFDSLGLNRRPTPAQEVQAVAWMAQLGMTMDRTTPFYRLSKGDQRLVLIARALVKEPKLLILDEPCQGLDAAHLQLVLSTLERITADPARTVIYVTHYTRAFPQGLTHILELVRGQVTRQGCMGTERTEIR